MAQLFDDGVVLDELLGVGVGELDRTAPAEEVLERDAVATGRVDRFDNERAWRHVRVVGRQAPICDEPRRNRSPLRRLELAHGAHASG